VTLQNTKVRSLLTINFYNTDKTRTLPDRENSPWPFRLGQGLPTSPLGQPGDRARRRRKDRRKRQETRKQKGGKNLNFKKGNSK